MGFLARTVLVTNTPTLLTIPQADGVAGSSLAVQVPAGGATVFVGGPTVTAATGWPLAPGVPFFADIDERLGGATFGDPREDLYGVVATGSQLVNELLRGI